MAGTGNYTAADIEVLTSQQAIRKRPGMYIGGTDDLLPLLWEVLGNAIDECLAGYARTVDVRIDGDSMTVEDDGRGVPTSEIARTFSTLMAGSKYTARKHRHLAIQLHGTGSTVTNALSRELAVTIWRDGVTVRQRFERGEVAGPLEHLGPTNRTGTRVTFAPDFTIMKKQAWNVARIAQRCRELAGIEPGIVLCVNGERFHYANVGAYVRDGREIVVEPFQCDVIEDGVGVRAAIAWHGGKSSQEMFVNGSPAKGAHVAAFARAVDRVFARRTKRVRRGTSAVLHVMLDDPRWGSPTREWLTNPEVAGIVERVIERELDRHLEEAPALLDALLLRWEATRARRSSARSCKARRGD